MKDTQKRLDEEIRVNAAIVYLLDEACQKSDIQPEGLTISGKISFLTRRIAAQSAEIARLREALEPFAHPDLCKRLPSNGSDENAVIFVRNQAVITLADCNRVARALEGEK